MLDKLQNIPEPQRAAVVSALETALDSILNAFPAAPVESRFVPANGDQYSTFDPSRNTVLHYVWRGDHVDLALLADGNVLSSNTDAELYGRVRKAKRRWMELARLSWGGVLPENGMDRYCAVIDIDKHERPFVSVQWMRLRVITPTAMTFKTEESLRDALVELGADTVMDVLDFPY